MVAEPPTTPVSMPELEPIVATDVLLLLQTPPLTASLIGKVPPAHIFITPRAEGIADTFKTLVTIQPLARE